MRYIGGKSKMLSNIDNTIDLNIDEKVDTFLDLFCGSGVVSSHYKNKGYEIGLNDMLYFSYVLNRGTIGINKVPELECLKTRLKNKNVLDYLNGLTLLDTDIKLDDCFIYRNFSLNDQCNRMYFTKDNAIKIDLIRQTIERWKVQGLLNEDEYYYLLSCLISAVPYVSNITGIYGAYLKHWDKRALNNLKLQQPIIINNGKCNECYNSDANKLVCDINKVYDLVYIDTPYNSRQYLPNYHILETIAKYDNPEVRGITGLRKYDNEKSDYCIKKKVNNAFDNLIKNVKGKYIVVSYNNEGLISTEDMISMLKKYAVDGKVILDEYEYRRYKNKIPNHTKGLKEQVYFIKKKGM